tara:strand:- start:973 stop:1437 length:465 start_codon:yes stop_codon:yes gene_type:complete
MRKLLHSGGHLPGVQWPCAGPAFGKGTNLPRLLVAQTAQDALRLDQPEIAIMGQIRKRNISFVHAGQQRVDGANLIEHFVDFCLSAFHLRALLGANSTAILSLLIRFRSAVVNEGQPGLGACRRRIEEIQMQPAQLAAGTKKPPILPSDRGLVQ